MSLFKISDKKLNIVKEKKFDLEKDIQTLTEDNIETIFGYKFISSEFRIDSFRFDTLAWDEENGAFIIIEYKKDRNYSVIDQGFTYLNTLLRRKADFILEYNTKSNKPLKKEDIDWSQSRVVFISPSFTTYQINSVNFKDMAFDLYEVKVYDNDTIAYNKIEGNSPVESIDLFVKDAGIENVQKEIKNYSVDDHFKEDWNASREMFDIIDERLLSIDPNLRKDPKKVYIGYKIGNMVLWDIVTSKNALTLELYRVKPEELNDPEKRTRYQPNSFKYFNKHVTQFKIEKEEDIEYAIMLAKQVYKRSIN